MNFEHWAIFGATLFALSLLLLAYGYYAYRKATYRNRFPGREILAPDVFIRTYYPHSTIDSDKIILIYQAAAHFFAVPTGILRPQDTFGDTLTAPILFPQLYGLDTADGVVKHLMLHLLRQLKRKYPKISPEDFSKGQIQNLGDVVDGFCSAIK